MFLDKIITKKNDAVFYQTLLFANAKKAKNSRKLFSKSKLNIFIILFKLILQYGFTLSSTPKQNLFIISSVFIQSMIVIHIKSYI